MKKEDLLLVIDMQNVYAAGGKWQCMHTEKAAENVCRIIDSGIKNVLFTKYLAAENPYGVWKNYNIQYADVNNDAYGNEILDVLKPYAEKYPVEIKSTYSSLTVESVKSACKKAYENGGRVVVTGVVAECCVLSTVMSLIDEGIYTVYLTDGVSGLDVPKEEATKLMFEGLSPLHVKMMTTDEYLKEGR